MGRRGGIEADHFAVTRHRADGGEAGLSFTVRNESDARRAEREWWLALVPELAMQAGAGQGQLCQLRHEIWKSELDRRSRELGLV